MKNRLIGVDIGSGGCKVIIIDETGKILGRSYQEWPTYYRHPGWSEQEPSDWEKALSITMKMAMDSGRIKPAEIGAITFGSATHSIVFLDERDQILRPAILWTDKRTIEQVDYLRMNYGELIFEETLHSPNVNWTLPYLIWVREKEPDVWKKTKRILMPKDYIRLRLTGAWATDPIDAVGTLLFNPRKREWSEKICNTFDIPLEILPPVLPPDHVAGVLNKESAHILGLKEGIPVIVGTTDQASEAFGAGAIDPGQGIVKLATAGNVATVTEAPHPDRSLVHSYLHLVAGQWYMLTGTRSCAVCYRWLRDAFFEDLKALEKTEGTPSYARMDDMAAEVPLGSEGLIFHPHLQGASIEPRMRGNFVGITFRHTRAYFARSVLEGVAFSLLAAREKIGSLGIRADNFRLIGGGSRSSLWQQIVCDVFGKEMIVPAVDDSSFGTAMLGGIAIGVFRDIREAVNRCVQYKQKLTPDAENHKIYQALFDRYKEIEEALVPTYRKLHEIKLPAPTI